MELIQSKEKVIERMESLEDLSQNTIRGIGTLEVLGAIGLILPPVADSCAVGRHRTVLSIFAYKKGVTGKLVTPFFTPAAENYPSFSS